MFGLQDCELSKNGNVSLCEIKAFESLCENLGFFISAICCCCWTGKIMDGVSHLVHSLQLIMGNYHTAWELSGS